MGLLLFFVTETVHEHIPNLVPLLTSLVDFQFQFSMTNFHHIPPVFAREQGLSSALMSSDC